VLLFTVGCSGKKESEDDSNNSNIENKSGRFIEYEVTPPIDGGFVTFLTEGDNIVCFDRGLKVRCDSQDGGKTWNESEGPGADNERFGNVESGSIAPDGSIFVYIEGEGIFKILPDGSDLKVPVKELDEVLANGEGIMFAGFKALSEDRLYLSWLAGGNFSIQRIEPGDNNEGGGGEEQGAVNDAGTDVSDVSGNSPAPATTGGGPSGSSPGGQNRSNVSIGPGDFHTGLYATDGSIVADFSNINIGLTATNGTSLFAIDNQSNQLLTFNLSDGKQSDAASIGLPGSSDGAGGSKMPAIGIGGGDGALAVDSEGSIYLMSDKDLIRVKSDGSSEVLLSGTNYSIGAPRMNVNAILPMSDGSLVVGLRSMEASKLYKYAWDENAYLDPAHALNIWSLEDSSFVRAVISAFRNSHPDVTINYEVALSDDSGITANDAIKNLNTRMLSGSAPDIILLDGCPAESYAAQGLLLDLMSMIDTSSIFENIIAPFKNSGSLWYIPSQIKFPVLLGQEDSISSIDSLETLTNMIVAGNGYPDIMPTYGPESVGLLKAERPVLYFSELRDLFDLIWASSATEVVSGGSLDMAALEKMLTALKSISDKYELCVANNEGGQMTTMFSDGSGAMRVPESAIWYSSEFTDFGAFTIYSLTLLALQSERPDSALAAFPGLTTDSFIPAGLAGISADTNIPELAAEFVQTMLSYEVQSVGFGTGMPVTKDGLDGQITSHNDRMRDSGRGNELKLDVASVIQSLKKPVLTNEVLTNAVWLEVEKLCKGETDLEKALKNIEQNVKNYLAERA